MAFSFGSRVNPGGPAEALGGLVGAVNTAVSPESRQAAANALTSAIVDVANAGGKFRRAQDLAKQQAVEAQRRADELAVAAKNAADAATRKAILEAKKKADDMAAAAGQHAEQLGSMVGSAVASQWPKPK